MFEVYETWTNVFGSGNVSRCTRSRITRPSMRSNCDCNYALVPRDLSHSAPQRKVLEVFFFFFFKKKKKRDPSKNS